MLKPYNLIEHSADKFQQYIDYIFYEIWCKPELEYDISCFANNSELYEIINEYHVNKKTDLLYEPIERIHKHFKKLDKNNQQFLEFIKEKYRINNDIQSLCQNRPGMEPITYKELAIMDKDFAEDLHKFCVSLWDELFDRKPLEMKIGTKKEHYEEFVRQNNVIVCQCCGLVDFKSEEQTYREAYDHYIPKSKYPFNTVNFKNLAPACNDCNSVYKKEKDPIFNGTKRRKAFYNYHKNETDILISMSHLVVTDAGDSLNDIAIDINSEKYDEEVQTWRDLFGIDERYKAKCIKYSKHWIQQYKKIVGNSNDPNRYFEYLGDDMFCEAAFLKKPFITAWLKEMAV